MNNFPAICLIKKLAVGIDKKSHVQAVSCNLVAQIGQLLTYAI